MSKPIQLDSQLLCRFPAPIDKRLYADSLLELVGRDVSNFFENMVVFVKDEQKFYMLIAGQSGNVTSDWLDIITFTSDSMRFMPYVNTKTYVVGSCVSIGAGMYIAIYDADTDEGPLTHPNKWLQLGATQSLVYDFVNETEITVSNTILNPIVQVFWAKSASEYVPITCGINVASGTHLVISFSEAISGKVIIK
jgi:hypothetical protein